jgi:hypothetical protein
VRKILRSDETDFSYERERRPMPQIGPWQGQLEQVLPANANNPSRGRLTLIRIFEVGGVAPLVRGMPDGAASAMRAVMMPCAGSPRPGRRTGGCDGRGLSAPLLRPGRSLPVRLEP